LIEIPLSEIVGVRESKSFNASVRGGRVHLVIAIRSGEVAFFVADTATWIDTITRACGLSSPRSAPIEI
jgi:hypothetical protein